MEQQNDKHATKTQAIVIIILLVCVLAASAATLALQFIPRAMGFNTEGGPDTQGFGSPPQSSPPAMQDNADQS